MWGHLYMVVKKRSAKELKDEAKLKELSALERKLTRHNITAKELDILLKQSGQSDWEQRTYKHYGKNVRLGVISDTHIGHKCYDSGLMDYAAEMFTKRKVDMILHTGDICDGLYINRPGHMFELEHISGDEQFKRAKKELSKLEQEIYGITGNHEENTFGKICGFNIGDRMASELDHYHDLGVQHGFVELAYGKKIQLIHPDGGTAYAISYKTQKIVESLEGGTKPEILLIGHFHKSEYLFYRNIHCYQTGTLERQTPFMKNKGIPAHCGFWILDAKVNKTGINSMKMEWFPAY